MLPDLEKAETVNTYGPLTRYKALCPCFSRVNTFGRENNISGRCTHNDALVTGEGMEAQKESES